MGWPGGVPTSPRASPTSNVACVSSNVLLTRCSLILLLSSSFILCFVLSSSFSLWFVFLLFFFLTYLRYYKQFATILSRSFKTLKTTKYFVSETEIIRELRKYDMDIWFNCTVINLFNLNEKQPKKCSVFQRICAYHWLLSIILLSSFYSSEMGRVLSWMVGTDRGGPEYGQRTVPFWYGKIILYTMIKLIITIK